MNSKAVTNPLSADAVTIPASARGAFHLPPADHSGRIEARR